MKQLKTIIGILLILSYLFVPVCANEDVASYSFSAPEPAVFSVTVPTSLPVYVDGYGNVTTSNSAVITNNSNDIVQVVNMEIESTSDYAITSYDENFRTKTINSKQFAMNINGSKTQGDGSLLFDTSGFGIIAAGTSHVITYGAKVTLSTERVTDLHVANVIFTIDWSNPITLIYDANGGSFSDSSTTNSVYYTNSGNLINGMYKEPSRQNCTFAGWYTDTDFVNELNIDSLTGDTTAYAKWTSEYTVTHSLQELWNSSSYVLDSTETLIGVVDKPNSPPVKTYDNYNSPSVKTVILDDSGNFVVEYKYNRRDYWLDVNYVIDGVFAGGPDDWQVWPSAFSSNFVYVYINGTLAGDVRDYCKTHKYETSYEVIVHDIPNGYYYAGTYNVGADYWNNGTTLYRRPSSGIITENVGMRLMFGAYDKASTYTITFNSNASRAYGSMSDVTYYGYMITGDDGNSHACSEIVTLPTCTFTRSGYTFAGWATSSNGSVVYANGETISGLSGDITLYAVWTRN